MGFPVNNKLDIDITSNDDLIKYTDFEGLNILRKNYFRGDEDMKFDVVVGNPPYQENDEGRRESGSKNASASPIYPQFVRLSGAISDLQSLIIPARWISGAGKGTTGFAKQMVGENKITNFIYYQDSKFIFPNNDIKGGICYFIRNNKYEGKAKVEVNFEGNVEKSERFLSKKNVNVFIPYVILSEILSKIMRKTDFEKESIQNIVSTLKPFGLRTDFFVNQKKYKLPTVYKKRKKNTDLKIYGLYELSRTVRYVPIDYPVVKGVGKIHVYKIFSSYAYGTGDFGEIIPETIVARPGDICTETFLSMGSFDSYLEAENLSKYMKTKFFRALVGVLKTTQHSTTTYRYVPLQDFSNNSDIRWNESIIAISQQLYLKYDLSQEEIAFIEEKVKSMD